MLFLRQRHAVPAFICFLLSLAIIVIGARTADAASVVPGQMLVGYTDDAGAAARTQAHAAANQTHVARMGMATTEVLAVPSMGAATMAAVRAVPGVDYAEPVYRTTQADATAAGFADQWSLSNTGQAGGTANADIDLLRAWQIQPAGSASVLVGSVDSGVNTAHPALAGLGLWANPGERGTDASGRDKATNGVDDDGDGCVDDLHGCDFVDGDGDPADANGHGTGTAAVAAAPAGSPYAGVAAGSSLIVARALDASGAGTTAQEAAALNYVAGQGARVVNVSLSGPKSLAVSRAITTHPDTLFVVSAGNSGADVDGAGVAYPCADPAANVVCVAATTRTDQLAAFSNYGATSVDLAAPGQDLDGLTLTGTGSLSGTSFSAPLVTGTAALALAAAPGTTVAALARALLDGAEALPSLAGRTVTGGRLSAYRTLAIVTGRQAAARVAVAVASPPAAAVAADVAPAAVPAAGATTATASPAAASSRAASTIHGHLTVTRHARRGATSARVTVACVGATACVGHAALLTKSGKAGRSVAFTVAAGRARVLVVPARRASVRRTTVLVVRTATAATRYGVVLTSR